MDKENFIARRNQWLEEVSNKCHEFALLCDLDFYVFQTPCNSYSPELLIIGINPGGEKSYSEILKCKGYKKRPSTDLGYDINTLTTKPMWEKGKGNDKMRSSFGKVFTEENNLKNTLKNAVMMNMCYFNTSHERALNGIENEIKEYCLGKTLEFIEILDPKNILFLTSKNSILKRSGVKNIDKIENNVKKGLLNNRIVYTIPHYGYYGAYSNDKSALMGNTLKEILQKP